MDLLQMRYLIPASLALAGLSLLIPSDLTYDPWAWVVWGREVFELDLDTNGGPSWKPGPVLLTTVFAPLEGIDSQLPGQLWLVVARAGGLLALALAFRLSRRLAGDHLAEGIVAGTVAVAALATLPLWLRYMLHGNEAPLAIAFMLWAIERHLDGRRDHATVLLFLACLLRPEVFPFLVVEAVIVWRAEPERRLMVTGLFASLPVLWLVPEWIGAGNPLDAGRQASAEPPWSLSLEDKPWLAALERADGLAGREVELAALAGIVAAAIRRQRELLVLAAIGILWLLLIVAMTQFGFSGSNRYFLAPLVAACLLAGAGVGAVVRGAADLADRFLPTRLAPPLAGAAAAAALAIPALSFIDTRGDGVGDQLRDAKRRNKVQTELMDAIERTGGGERVLGYGEPRINRAFHPRMAWELHAPIGRLEHSVGGGLVFRQKPRKPGPAYRLLVREGRWRIYREREINRAKL